MTSSVPSVSLTQSDDFCQSDLTSTPTKQEILDYVVPYVSPNWYELGVKLLKKGQDAHLDVIQANHFNNNKKCCMGMFWYWLSSNPNATWQQLITALRSPAIELPVIATDLEKMFKVQSKLEPSSSHDDSQEGTHTDQQRDAQSLVISKEEFESYGDVGKAFIKLQTKLCIILKNENFPAVRRACITQMHNPGGAELSEKLINQISSKQNIDDLFDELVQSPYWSWIDIRILEVMVIASENSLVAEILSNYKAVVFSKKIIDLLPNVPSKKVKEEYYSKMLAKVNQDHNEMTVADLLKFQSQLEAVILDIKKGICILEHLENGCIEVHWYIPNDYVDGAYQTARVKSYCFNHLHLQCLKIGHYPVIYDPLANSKVVTSAPSPSVYVATVKDFINYYYDYLSVNMDAEAVTQLMVSQRLLSEDAVLAASSDYQKNCLVLQQVRPMNVASLVSFGELLLTSDSQKHFGTMLLDDHSFLMSSKNPDEHIEQESQEELTTKIDSSSVVTEYLNMKFQLEELLKLCDPTTIMKKCGPLLASEINGIPLFPAEMFQGVKHTSELIQKICLFITWDNHSILSAIAEASNIPEAIMLLAQFDDRINSSQPLMNFPIPAPSCHMVPYDDSTHTILAIKLDLELSHSTLQNIIEARSLIQKQCKLTSHCLQLLAIAKTNSTLYWMIPRSIAHLITANAVQFQSYYYQKGILQFAVYPGAVICTGSALKVGPLSLFNDIAIDGKLPTKTPSDDLNIELSQLEELPQIISKLHKEIIVAIKMVKSQSLGDDVHRELENLQLAINNVNISLEKVEVIRKYGSNKNWSEASELLSKGVEEFATKELSLVNQLKKLTSSLTSMEDLSEVMQQLQTELSDRKLTVDKLETQLVESQVQLQCIQKEKVNTIQLSSELSEKLVVMEEELMKLREEKKELLNLLSDRKDKGRKIDKRIKQKMSEEASEFGAALQSKECKIKWIVCSDLPVAMRSAHSTIINETLYIGGGFCSTISDEYLMFSYNLTDDKWERLPVLPQCYGVPANINNELSVVGGYDFSTSNPTNKIITLLDNQWIMHYPNMKEERMHHALVSHQHYTIVAGGVGKDQPLLDTIEVFNCNNYQWTIASTKLPDLMKNISMTICNQSFVITGYTDGDDNSYDETFTISVDSLIETKQPEFHTSQDDHKWSELCHTEYWNTSMVPNTYPPVIIGGDDEEFKAVKNISLYDKSSDSWRTISQLPISCAGATVTAVNNTMIITGGYTDGKDIDATMLTSVMLGELELKHNHTATGCI